MIEKKFYTIKEASRITGVKPYVLRYWESEFKLLRPARRESGQRRYTKEDIELIERIKHLLYVEKYSIKGAREKLLEERRKKKEQLELEFYKNVPALKLLKEIKKELKGILKILE
ncbi:MAG: MerR family transcriptional regulator [Caldiserica bacterium]|nr:MAG: MerR family transcriptional regulator [Caldisericota bacterium]